MSFCIFNFETNPRPPAGQNHPRLLSPGRYIAVMALTGLAAFALVWVWIAAMPLAFLDPEYASWRAKQALLDSCDLGEVLILGDSRAAAGLMPVLWPVRGTNLAVGGGEAIEALAALTRALRCPTPPKRVILSLDAGHVVAPDLFWERTVRFGFLDGKEIATLRRVSGALNDPSVYEIRHTDGLPSGLRDAMYRARFPSLYFASLVKGGVLLRWRRNETALAAGIAARGHYFFGTDPGSDVIAADGHLRAFRPLPVLDWYFTQVLTMLAARGIRADFVAVPMNETTSDAVDPEVRAGFAAWLAGYRARFPDFHVAGDAMPHWPDRLFGDGFAHLNREGAALFSAGLGYCLTAPTLSPSCVQRLQAAPPNTQNDAQYGWFNATGRAASASVVPSSKRGS